MILCPISGSKADIYDPDHDLKMLIFEELNESYDWKTQKNQNDPDDVWF